MFGADEAKSGIYLPKGTWVDSWTGKVDQGPTTVNGYHAALDTLPLFVKAGAVVPMWKTGIDPGKTVTTKLAVTPAASVKPASFTLRLDASYQVHEDSSQSSTVATAQLPYASLSQAATVVGVSSKSFAQGNFDGSGDSFNGKALAAAGYTPGAKWCLPGPGHGRREARRLREGPVYPSRSGRHHHGLPPVTERP